MVRSDDGDAPLGTVIGIDERYNMDIALISFLYTLL